MGYLPKSCLCLKGIPLYLCMCCLCLGILGFLNFFASFIIGFVIGAFMIALSFMGCFGAMFKPKKTLLYFMIGVGLLCLFNVAAVGWAIYETVATDESRVLTIVIDSIAFIFYGICLFLAFSIRSEKKWGWFSVPDTV
eukprot:TRINITY_DN917_c0_g1_i1.p1 TRINITY_DN917_c0_g1~~TRINITY_DN917_c0_g1_i1.p1  ORF type:complete len:138 (+),score=6.40 TRINITY_DN917_c0_g1_i1:189-602(+)